MELNFEEDFIFPELQVSDFDSAVGTIADRLVQKGYVVPDFKEKVISREKGFPTGLVLPTMNIGIPHTEAENVHKTVVSVATLNQKIKMHSMIDPTSEIEVSMLFLIAVSDPSGQVKILRQLMRLFQNEKLLEQISSSNSSKEILQLLNENK